MKIVWSITLIDCASYAHPFLEYYPTRYVDRPIGICFMIQIGSRKKVSVSDSSPWTNEKGIAYETTIENQMRSPLTCFCFWAIEKALICDTVTLLCICCSWGVYKWTTDDDHNATMNVLCATFLILLWDFTCRKKENDDSKDVMYCCLLTFSNLLCHTSLCFWILDTSPPKTAGGNIG